MILAVLALEAFALLLKGNLILAPIYLLAVVRVLDTLILLSKGPWSFKGAHTWRATKAALMGALIVSLAGILFLAGWKNIFGSSMLKVDITAFLQSKAAIITFYLTAVLFSPLAEELVFRGLLYRRLREKMNMWISVGIVSLLFSGIHFYFGGNTLLSLGGSLIFCFGYEKSKFILTPIFLHIAGNSIIFASPFFSFI